MVARPRAAVRVASAAAFTVAMTATMRPGGPFNVGLTEG